jgi:PAS domain S-box-containing protein
MTDLLDTLLESINDGIVAVDRDGRITHFNQAAGRITGLTSEQAIGRPVSEALPRSRLPIVLEQGVADIDHQQAVSPNKRIIANRIPILDKTGRVAGAISIFRDMTAVADLTDQNIALKKIQSLLEAIINASEDAISVVDEKGMGMMINPAYTRLTGLKREDFLGKPADIDIAEGDSVHMQVLTTRKPVRGAHLKVRQHNRDVMVNVAPITVDGDLKGSVAIIHDISELKRLTDELTKANRLIRTLSAKYTFGDIVGDSEQIQTAVHWARKAAQVPATVLLRGESGTGKELFAHAIHNSSDRQSQQFIRVNCAAVVETLFESELFGYEEGAFTGAKRGGKKGFFEEANGGTIFFDEISELSKNTQAKLLRVLQEKEIVRVGASKTIPVDVRVIAATHVNLEEAVQEGRFRQDLYYRLNVMPIVIPPLRHHTEDLRDLADHIVGKLNQEFGRKIASIDPCTLSCLERYPWYGNVRELENVLSQAITKMRFNEAVILPTHLPTLVEKDQPRSRSRAEMAPALLSPNGNIGFKEAMNRAEKEYVTLILAETHGNRTAAARRMGVSLRNLYNKIEKHGLMKSSR